MIKSGAVVFPCDRRRKFNQFRLTESLAQAGEQHVGNIHGRVRHDVGVLKNKTLQFGEIGVGPVVLQISNLPGGDTVCPANGGADINSKRAPDEGRNSEFG